MDIVTDNVRTHERKVSSITLNTDSGVSSIINEDTCMYMYNEHEKMDDYRTIRSTGGRVSLDENHRTSGEFSKLIETNVRSRKSRSLPDILDIDNVCDIEENFDDFNKTCDSSDLNLSFEEPEDGCISPQKKVGRGSLLPIQVCGKEHVEEPCFICMKDNEIYCSVCVQVHNFHCKDKVKFIPEIPPELRTKFCGETVRDLRIMKERFTKVKHENEEALSKLYESKKTFIHSVMKYKNQIMQTVDRIEKEAFQEMDSLFNEETNRIQTNLEYLDRELNNLDSYLKVLDQERSNWGNSVVFDMQEATKQVRYDETAIRDFHKSTNVVQLNFEPLQNLTNLLSDFDELWKVTKCEIECCRYPSPCSCDKSYQYKSAEREKEVSVRLSGWSFDRERCCITGCEFLPNGKLLICDNANKKVKLLDKKFKCISAQSLPSLPWDLAVIDAHKAVVTIPDRKQLQYIDMNSRKLALKRSVLLDQNCWGVECDGTAIFVTCWSRDAAEVVVLDLLGVPQRRITTIDGTPLHTPWFVDCCNDSVYVSDWGTYVVQCMDATGVSLAKYRNSYLVGPLGVAHDPEGNVYVCGRDSNTIHQLSPDGQLQQVILTEKDGVQQPLNISHRRLDDKLIVTSWMSDKITIYKLQ